MATPKNKVGAGEFEKLFRSARTEHRTAQVSGPAHKAALAFCKKYKILGGETILKASLLDWQGKEQAALVLLDKAKLKNKELRLPVHFCKRNNPIRFEKIRRE
jgi:hypothetical protein